MPNDVQIRPELIKAGYTNADIGYDPTRKMTTLRGQDFLGAGNFTNVAGSAFTDRQKFDTALNKYKQGQQPITQVSGMGATGTAAVQPAYVNPTDQRYNDLLDILYQQAQTPQQVDVNAIYASPQYAAAQAQAQRGAQQGIRAAQEALGSAGFGRSTTLGESAQREQNIANEYLQTQVLPQLIAQAEERKRQQFQEQFSVLDALTKERESARQFGLQEAGVTGRLYSEQERAAQPLLNQLTSLGEAWKTGTPEQQVAYSQRADDIRAQLTQMGIDPSLYAPSLTTEQRRTAGQELGIPTLGAQELKQKELQQAWENNFRSGQFDFQKAQQIYENAFKERSFEQDMKEAAASRGLQWASLNQRDKEFVADQAFRERQFEWQKEQQSKQKRPKIDAKTSADNYDLLYDDLQTEGITKEQGRQLIEANLDSLTDSDYKKLKEWVNDNL